MTTSTAMQVIQVLEAQGFKKRGDQWRGNSPFRAGSDSNGFAVRIDGDEHGAYTDHASGESGSLYELAEKLGIKPKTTPVANTKRGYDSLSDYAAAHGVAVSVLEAAGWKQSTYGDRLAAEIPTVNGTRYRFLDGGKGSPYINPKGYKTCWYGLERAVHLAQTTSKPIVICNGEASTVVAQHYGIPAVAATSGERNVTNAELIKEFRQSWQGNVIIALDCDDTGRRVSKEAVQLYPKAKAVDMRLSEHGDLADFCKLHTDTAMSELVKLAVETPRVDVSDNPVTEFKKAVQDLRKLAGQTDEKEMTQKAILRAQEQLDVIGAQFAEPDIALLVDVGLDVVADAQWAMDNPGKMKGLRTRFPTLDKLTWGLQKDNLYAVYGATGMGKSTFCASLAANLIDQAPGLIMPSELGAAGWVRKLFAAKTGISEHQIIRGWLKNDERQRLTDAVNWFASSETVLMQSSAPTLNALIASVYAAVDKYNCQWVIVDSINNMVVPGADGLFSETSAAADGLLSLAIDAHLPIVFTAQVARNQKDRRKEDKRPKLQDAQGSHRIEQNAAFVGGMYNHDYYVQRGEADADDTWEPDTAEMILLKNRAWAEMVGSIVPLKHRGGGFGELSTKTYDELMGA